MENAKIMVVDDDPGIRDSLQTILESRHYTVITAADRTEGMDKIRTERPDLLILDIMMSSWLDGLDMSKKLKKDPEFSDMPIVMLTGVKERTAFDFRPKDGGPDWCSVDAYLDKPVGLTALLAEVERLLPKKA
ncbi:MAG TPA: response regulator [Sedimentisphaerales bacterium]|jgi:CheY-like chemotaxis protein|nr:response regulator [Sedimentisphaerales bacterium]